MNMEKQTLSLVKSALVPDAYFQENRRRREYDMWINLFSTLAEGEWYSIKIERRNQPVYETHYTPGYEIGEQFDTDVYVGKIKPVYMEWKPVSKLSFIQRIKVLFTGKYPQEIVRK